MANMSNYAETQALAYLISGTTMVDGKPVTGTGKTYLALYTSNPTEADMGMEVTDSAYSRRPVTFAPPKMVSGMMTVENTNLVSFPKAQSSYGTVSHIGIRDAATGGNLLFFANLAAPLTVDAGAGLDFVIGGIRIAMD